MTVSLPILLLGLLLGARHALEADHVAAVATLATRSRSLRGGMTLAAVWGVGHAATLIVIGAALIVLGVTMPVALEQAFEGVVGAVLVMLGFDVLRRVWREQVHFHAHTHDGARLHLHAHGHGAAPAPACGSAHDHDHPRHPLRRALVVGAAHGLAGSGAAAILAVQGAASPAGALAGLGLFALGSIGGMMVFSAAITVPMRSARVAGVAARGLQGTLGAVSVALGAWIVVTATLGG